MSASNANNRRLRSQRTAADLVARGYPHGVRQSRPRPNSGGDTMVWAAGSAKAQRRAARIMKAAQSK